MGGSSFWRKGGNLKNAVIHAKSRSPRRKTDGYAKHVNHLVGEVPLFNNSLISLRLRVFA
jgi:hypothetical protein